MMPRVCHDQPPVVHQNPGRQIHSALRTPPASRPALRFTVGLPQYDVGGLLVVLRHSVPDEHTMVAGIGHHYVLLTEEHSAG